MKWNKISQKLPANGEVVWCRNNYFYGTPFLGTYTTTDQTFTCNITAIIFPSWTIARWRYQ